MCGVGSRRNSEARLLSHTPAQLLVAGISGAWAASRHGGCGEVATQSSLLVLLLLLLLLSHQHEQGPAGPGSPT
jgi:hypothetical protein